jgi:hypothetical protein
MRCQLTIYCTDIPCDGSVEPACDVDNPDNLNGPACNCPACDWDHDFCMWPEPAPGNPFVAPQPCPDGWVCEFDDPNLDYGHRCVCDSDDCM